jgi:hypothetical protein
MKRTLIIAGVVMLIAGMVWLLQGVGILPGSVMSGEPFWAWAGLVFLVAGVTLLFFGLTKRSS